MHRSRSNRDRRDMDEDSKPCSHEYFFHVICRRETDDTAAQDFTKYLTDYLETEVSRRLGRPICGYYAERDAIVGSNVISEILRVLDSSRVTLVVLTDKFIESSWEKYWVLVPFQARVRHGERDRYSKFIPIAFGAGQNEIDTLRHAFSLKEVVYVPQEAYQYRGAWQSKLLDILVPPPADPSRSFHSKETGRDHFSRIVPSASSQGSLPGYLLDTSFSRRPAVEGNTSWMSNVTFTADTDTSSETRLLSLHYQTNTQEGRNESSSDLPFAPDSVGPCPGSVQHNSHLPVSLRPNVRGPPCNDSNAAADSADAAGILDSISSNRATDSVSQVPFGTPNTEADGFTVSLEDRILEDHGHGPRDRVISEEVLTDDLPTDMIGISFTGNVCEDSEVPDNADSISIVSAASDLSSLDLDSNPVESLKENFENASTVFINPQDEEPGEVHIAHGVNNGINADGHKIKTQQKSKKKKNPTEGTESSSRDGEHVENAREIGANQRIHAETKHETDCKEGKELQSPTPSLLKEALFVVMKELYVLLKP